MDVTPSAGQQWQATCSDCGAQRVVPHQPDAWTWLLDHPCDSVPTQRASLDDGPGTGADQ